LSDSPELLKPSEVTDKQLQNELSNLKIENEKLQADYAALLESSTHVTNKLREEVQELRSQLATEKRSWDELRDELDDSEKTCAELRGKLADREKELAESLVEVSDLKQKSATTGEFPDAADLLNQLKAKRKKSKIDLVDVETLLNILES
jgi:chromosome segregation ATPase